MMMYRKEILTAIGTLGCAAAIGFAMQSTDAAKERYGKEDIQQTIEAIEKTAHLEEGALDVQGITLTHASFDQVIPEPAKAEPVDPIVVPKPPMQAESQPSTPSVVVAQNASSGGVFNLLSNVLGGDEMEPTPVSAPASAVDLPADASMATPANPACDIIVGARPMAAAIVNVTVEAACLGNERLDVHHSGMVFSETTDAAGKLSIDVPALATEALFIVAFSNGDGGVAQTRVEEMADFDRVVLQSKARAGMEIHAREFGADYGEDGHVWADAARDLSFAVTGQGGFLTTLGNADVANPLLAEVYTFPSKATQKAGDIALTAETEVSLNNCGLEIEATALQVIRGGEVTSRDLSIAVPDCDAAGSFLVLNNLFEDLKVASN